MSLVAQVPIAFSKPTSPRMMIRVKVDGHTVSKYVAINR